jgi:hypothetical protein
MNKIETEEINLDIEIVTRTIKSLKCNTLCGVGEVPAELLKSGTEKLYELLRRIFERCLNGDEIPNAWKIGYISAVHKKERKMNMKTTEELQY